MKTILEFVHNLQKFASWGQKTSCGFARGLFIAWMILLLGGSLSASTKESLPENSQEKEQTHSALQSTQSLCPKIYPLKLIFGNYIHISGAQEVLKKLQEDAVYPELMRMAQEHSFVIHLRPLSGYNILVVEPITDKAVHEEVMRMMKPMFEDIYSACARAGKKDTSSLKEDVTPSIAKNSTPEAKSTAQELAVQESNATNTPTKDAAESKERMSFKEQIQSVVQETPVAQDVSVQTVTEAEQDSFAERSMWLLIVGAVFGVLILLYLKFRQTNSKY